MLVRTAIGRNLEKRTKGLAGVTASGRKRTLALYGVVPDCRPLRRGELLSLRWSDVDIHAMSLGDARHDRFRRRAAYVRGSDPRHW